MREKSPIQCYPEVEGSKHEVKDCHLIDAFLIFNSASPEGLLSSLKQNLPLNLLETMKSHPHVRGGAKGLTEASLHGKKAISDKYSLGEHLW